MKATLPYLEQESVRVCQSPHPLGLPLQAALSPRQMLFRVNQHQPQPPHHHHQQQHPNLQVKKDDAEHPHPPNGSLVHSKTSIYTQKTLTVLQRCLSHPFVGIYPEKNEIPGMRMSIMLHIILVDGVERFLVLVLDRELD